MKLTALLGCLVLAGCATGGSSSDPGSPPAQRETVTRLETGEGNIDLRTTRTDPTGAFAIAASPERVFRALTVAYADMNITATTMDSRAMQLGVQNQRVRRQLGGVRLSRYLSCGERLGQLAADTDEIMLTLMTQVVPREDGGSVLRTLVEATARQAGSSTGQVNCATSGELERRIVDLVKKHVAS